MNIRSDIKKCLPNQFYYFQLREFIQFAALYFIYFFFMYKVLRHTVPRIIWICSQDLIQTKQFKNSEIGDHNICPMCLIEFHPEMEVIKLDVCNCKVAYCPGCFASWGKCVICFKTPQRSFILDKLHKINDFIVFEVDVLWNEIEGNFIVCCSILILIILYI